MHGLRAVSHFSSVHWWMLVEYLFHTSDALRKRLEDLLVPTPAAWPLEDSKNCSLSEWLLMRLWSEYSRIIIQFSINRNSLHIEQYSMYALPSILLYTCSVRKLVECFIGPLPWGTSPVSADSQSALVLARGEPHPCVQSEANFLASALATPGGWCVAIQLAWSSLHTIWFLIQRHQKDLNLNWL